MLNTTHEIGIGDYPRYEHTNSDTQRSKSDIDIGIVHASFRQAVNTRLWI